MAGEGIVGFYATGEKKKIQLRHPNVLRRDVQAVRAQSGALGDIREHNPKLEGT